MTVAAVLGDPEAKMAYMIKHQFPVRHELVRISSHSGPQADSVRSQNPREWKKQKTILLNSFWTWNAFVKELGDPEAKMAYMIKHQFPVRHELVRKHPTRSSGTPA
jgi:hypothetical protein